MTRGGQSVTEYALLVAAMATAVASMQWVLQRALQAQTKQVADHVLSVFPHDLTDQRGEALPPGRRGERTQLRGMEIVPPGAGLVVDDLRSLSCVANEELPRLGDGSYSAIACASRERAWTESRSPAGLTVRDATCEGCAFSSVSVQGKERFVDRVEIPLFPKRPRDGRDRPNGSPAPQR